jgi:hypothetical protein
MGKLANHTALKEWSNVIEALGRGEQVILVRKGGIADPDFGVEADRFYLYPTFYHQPAADPEPHEVTISHWCEVVRTWRIRGENAPVRLSPFVVLPRDAVETRYRFRPDQALHVIAVRAFCLRQPVRIVVKPEYLGCRSWVSLDDEIDVDGSAAILREQELLERIDAIDAAIREAATLV